MYISPLSFPRVFGEWITLVWPGLPIGGPRKGSDEHQRSRAREGKQMAVRGVLLPGRMQALRLSPASREHENTPTSRL
jgi:hypothetical protein